MHRVELKGINSISLPIGWPPFLMHRVELKVERKFLDDLDNHVPNAPCGVERSLS